MEDMVNITDIEDTTMVTTDMVTTDMVTVMVVQSLKKLKLLP